MARIRSIHPGLFTDETFVTLSPAAQILWIGLWCEADDQGAFEWKPITLKMRLLPASEDPIGPLLAELAGAGCIQQYAIDDRQYGVIRNFVRYQRPKAPKEVHPLPLRLRNYAGFTSAGGRPSAGTGRKRGGTTSEPGTAQKHDDFETGSEPEDALRAEASEQHDNDGAAFPNEFGNGSEALPELERRGRREEEGWRNPSRELTDPDMAGGGTSHVHTPAHAREGEPRPRPAPRRPDDSHPPRSRGLDSPAHDGRDVAAGGAR